MLLIADILQMKLFELNLWIRQSVSLKKYKDQCQFRILWLAQFPVVLEVLGFSLFPCYNTKTTNPGKNVNPPLIV